jgi:hypothetical protein
MAVREQLQNQIWRFSRNLIDLLDYVFLIFVTNHKIVTISKHIGKRLGIDRKLQEKEPYWWLEYADHKFM